MTPGRYDFFDQAQDLPHLLICRECGVPVLGFSVEVHERFHERLEGVRGQETAEAA